MPIHRHEGEVDSLGSQKGSILGIGPWWGNVLQTLHSAVNAKSQQDSVQGVKVDQTIHTFPPALLTCATLTFVIRFLAVLQGCTGVVEVDATFEGEVDGSEYGVAAV